MPISGCAKSDNLIVIWPVCDQPERAGRMESVLRPQLDALAESGVDVTVIEHIADIGIDSLRNSRILFAFCLSAAGINLEYYRLLEHLRKYPGCLTGSVAGIIVDGGGEFYTKAIARRFAFSANMAGCTFPGRALVEATGNLDNFHVLSNVSGMSLSEVYSDQVHALIERVLSFNDPVQRGRLKVLAVHASSRKTSNTLLLWDKVKSSLSERCDITEISLRNGQVYDCRGCSYETCLHFGETGSCFYSGVITEQVFPAILEADVLVLICPNYNDSVSANLIAFINRLTALFRSNSFSEKRIYALIVSGYSGGDIIAEQLIGALSFNKSFILPPSFAMAETANDPESILLVDDIDEKARLFAAHIA